jgi:hypothetical protein
MPESVTGGQSTETSQGQTTEQSTGQTTQQPGQQQSTQQTQQPPPQQRTGAEDTSRWERERAGLLADLKKEREARQAHEKRVAELSGTLTTEQKRVRALAGLEVKSPEDQELDQVRERVKQLFPVLAKLDESKIDQLLGMTDKLGSAEEVVQHHWTQHGQRMLDAVSNEVSDAVGRDLTERQQKALWRAYTVEAENNPEFLARHNQGDPNLAKEFAKAWVEDWFESARKSVVTEEIGRRRPVPNGRDRNVNTQPLKKIDYKNEKAVEDAMVESYRQHGGRFDV